jgi:peptide/nickel transport system substrate-binding protein
MDQTTPFERGSTRRKFLRGAALLGGVAVGSGLLAACAPAAPAPPAATTAPPPAAPTSAPAPAPAPTSAPAQAAAAAPSQLPRNQTLYVAGWQWGPPTTFNPLATGLAGWPTQGAPNTPLMDIYESLFTFNLFTGALDPLLGKDLSWPDPTTAVITLQPGTHFQDGTALTAEDVAYTFGLGKKYTDSFYNVLFDYVDSVTATGAQTVQFKLNPDRLNPGIVKQYLTNVPILPKAIWQGRESGSSLNGYVDMQPVGSGPYKLMSQSAERIAVVRDDNYWGTALFGTPAPKYIVHPIFKSNDDGNLAFQRGEVDLSQQFTPQIWQMWEKLNQPVGTWFKQEPYHLPGNLPTMFINIQRKGLDDPRVRRALAYSIDYAQIAQTAMSRYSIPAKASLMVAGGIEQKYMDEEAIAKEGWSFDPQKAAQILEGEVGAKKGDDGVYTLPDGTRLGPFKVITPYGWTDWMTALELVSQGAKASGLDISTEFPEAPVVNTRVGNADFDLALWPVSGVSASSPWLRFRDFLDSRGVPAAGTRAFWDFNRYSNDQVGPLLEKAAAATSDAEKKEFYGQLDSLFRKDVPVIPLMYRPLEFYEYNQTVWTGFPTSDNPTSPPTQSGSGIRLLYGLKAKA